MYQLKLLVGPGVNYIVIGKKVMATEKKDRPWDGRSRPADDNYRKNFERIFGKKKPEDPFDTKSTAELLDEVELSDEELKEIEDRNGF